VLRVAMLVALSFGVVLFTSAIFEDIPLVDTMRMAIVVAGLIPNGLFLAIAAAYALSAVRIARRGVLAQQANAIESLSHVSVLCLDKTGTLTTGRLVVDELTPLGVDAPALRRELGRFAATVRGPNRTVAAIAAALPSASGPLESEVVFAAERRWSAVQYADNDRASYILGAPDVLLVEPEPAAAAAIAKATANGRRVLLFARSSTRIADGEGETSRLPAPLDPLGIVSLRDELRPEVRTTLEQFASSGVRVKLISGDHPETVRAIAATAGIADRAAVVHGDDIEAAEDPELGRMALDCDLFARVGPREKARLVTALRHEGEVVAMIGDGINDVLALKASNLALSLHSGAPAARAVADLVLLDDSFAALPLVVREGQRIVTAMHDILRLFLTRVVYAAVVIATVAMIGTSFPFTPRQNALLSLMAVGLPSFILAALQPVAGAARPTADARSLLRSVLPAGWSLAMLGFVVYAATLGRDLAGGVDRDVAELAAQSALVHLSVWSGLLLFAFGPAAPGPGASGARLRWGLVVAAVVLGALFAVGSAVPSLASLFDLGPVAPAASLALFGGGLLWLVGLRWLSAGLPRWTIGEPARARRAFIPRSDGLAHPGSERP
jgi:cation-transporting ATPase E